MPGQDGVSIPFGAVTSTDSGLSRGWADGATRTTTTTQSSFLPSANTPGTLGLASSNDPELIARRQRGRVSRRQAPSNPLVRRHLVARTGPTKVHYDMTLQAAESGAAVYVINTDRRGSPSPSTHTAGRVLTRHRSLLPYSQSTAWKA